MTTGVPEATTLLALHRAGRLASDYPAVRGLLDQLCGTDLDRAGLLLSRLDPDEVLRAHPATPQVKVAVTGHGMLAPLIPALYAELARHGLLARTYSSDFDSYVFDLASPDSDLYAADPDLVLCLLDPMVIFDDVAGPWQPADIERVAQAKHALIERLVVQFETTSHGTLVLNTLPLPGRFTGQLVAQMSRVRLSMAWRELNITLLRLAQEHSRVVVLDLDPLIAEGIPAEDPRMSAYARAYLSPALLARYARDVGHLARHLTGQTKKALALDLDGSLWGGVLGDDGPDGIEIGDTPRGAAFSAFQRVIKQLGSQGVLLTAVTKNDAEAVKAVFRDHPRMVLREEDFIRIAANWLPKNDNLAEIADALNLSTDSFVFVDDSTYECGLIRHALPGVEVVQLTGEPALHIANLLRDGWFDTRELTDEDRSRGEKYQKDVTRRDFLDSFGSLEEYLRELLVTVALTPVNAPEAARVSQLTQRTNQFNLTARRLQRAEVCDLIADPSALTLGIHAGDRFGDHGLVGAVFARRSGDTLYIDNLVLSCRVFSRGIEQACLAAILMHARAAGLAQVVGEYRATAKNAKVADFYSRSGFTLRDGQPAAATYRHDLAVIAPPPSHVQLSHHLGEDES